MTRANLRRKKGFTLAEILVALALVALLAAVLLPTVAGQILKGDAGRVLQDLNSVRAGIETFLADVHRYPGKYSDLSKAILAAGTDINGATYGAGLAGKWAGPYVTKDTISATVETGFAGTIQNTFTKVANTNGINYVTVTVLGITQTDFDTKVDPQFDGTTATPRTTGLLRMAGSPDSTRYLAVPIQ